MQVILLERIAKIGQMGDEVTVKTGYARNFLLPQGKALRANAANRAQFEAQRADLEKRNDERKAVLRVQATKQKANDDEQAYNARLCQAIYRCGNVFSEPQKTTFFVNGLLPDTRSRVARHRESIPRHAFRYNKIVQYARDEGETARAQRVSSRQVPRGTAPGNQALYLHENHHEYTNPCTHQEQILLMGQGNQASTVTQPVSDRTSDLPSTQYLEGHHEELYMVSPPHVPHSDNRTDKNRPG